MAGGEWSPKAAIEEAGWTREQVQHYIDAIVEAEDDAARQVGLPSPHGLTLTLALTAHPGPPPSS